LVLVKSASRPPELSVAWFCVRSQLKREHIAARHLRQMDGVEVLLPRVRFRRGTRQGTVWVTEALFPNYLFARFHWRESLRLVHHSPGVAGVVHFGDRWPTIPDAAIEDLRQLIGTEELRELPDEFQPGEAVRISGGSFHGFEAVVQRAMPGRQRVAVLLEFLGRQTTVEVAVASLIRQSSERARIL
jgi:transcriptional antiterminator RfaH